MMRGKLNGEGDAPKIECGGAIWERVRDVLGIEALSHP
eukprot:CAMPEP_0175945560 /NCGR_PEP_ID=MMETSP0108-20121206/26783_1 /TAXON_ID=195067 ORGANISM="Goniomonas pacifica, Strain CCMP1869" /NCGR_SAMPLE_ID=MMETSP0108 /ASSEMBLY_ACC=CAM_ASM_000204 /LENGTH=37 /DNA_ID= /DNA_START= /DNA_END= /DNA_ORIENTATION=